MKQEIRKLSALAALCVPIALAGCSSDSKNEEPRPVRATEQGEVRGVQQGSMLSFKGIPYAAPPVGELRFAAPQPAAAWDGVLEADTAGSVCPQVDQAAGTLIGDEDCLYLNVFAPEAEGEYPVMVWIHGGAFIFGDGWDGGSYNPARLVENDVVVVTMNYRLGVLGFLAHEELRDEEGASGSYGIMDQQLALQWVQDNIANFNGNPENVTIFGESAGGLSVLSHLVSPASTGLFDKAIVQSGAYEAMQQSQGDAEEAGAERFPDCDADCLRELSIPEIFAAQGASQFTPNLRNDVLPLSVGVALRTGSFNKVPVLMGSNTDEWSYFVALGAEVTADNYEDNLRGVFEDALTEAQVDQIVEKYSLDEFGGDAAKALVAAGTDGVFACGALGQANMLAQAGVAVYAYEFADRDAPHLPGLPKPEWLDLGATHASEIQYIFGSDGVFSYRGATDDQVELAHRMTQAWANFAHNDDPNPADGTSFWADFSTGNMVSFVPPQAETLHWMQFADSHRCGFWNDL